MEIIGNIPEGAQTKMNSIIPASYKIKIVWADVHEVHVVGLVRRGAEMNNYLFGYRFFKLSTGNWEWSADVDGELTT